MLSTRHVIYREIHSRTYFWNTCGWSRVLRTARRYNTDDCTATMNRMHNDGLNPTHLTLRFDSRGRAV